MSSVLLMVGPMPLARFHAYGTEIGAMPWAQQSWGRMRLPTETIGNCNLTLTNVVVGSIYEVEPLAGGAAIALGTAGASSVLLTIPVYPGGAPANGLRVKVRKATVSPYYQPYETQVIASVGDASVFVNQLPDE